MDVQKEPSEQVTEIVLRDVAELPSCANVVLNVELMLQPFALCLQSVSRAVQPSCSILAHLMGFATVPSLPMFVTESGIDPQSPDCSLQCTR